MNRVVSRWLLLSLILVSLSAALYAQIGVGISVRIGPPALPVYAQPICPGPGYFWTPGYWGWSDVNGYYWVPGTWVVAPVGMLWTPGYWGWGGGFYAWHGGYWGPHIGFYGGINYGFGYGGVGFVGGEWRGGAFYYNRSVTNVSVTNVTNVYNRTVVVNNTSTTSFNGGTNGIQARPTAQEQSYANEPHTAALPAQTQHEQAASQNRGNFASVNGGRPAVAATARPGDFSSRSAVPARAAGAEYHAPAMSPKEARVTTPAASHGSSSEGFRPFTPPSKSSTSTSTSSASTHSGSGSGGNQYHPPAQTQSHSYQSQNSSHGSSGKSSPPPKHQSAPPKEEHRR